MGALFERFMSELFESAAEHLRPGESFEEGALRGLREELGVADAVLKRSGCDRRGRAMLRFFVRLRGKQGA